MVNNTVAGQAGVTLLTTIILFSMWIRWIENTKYFWETLDKYHNINSQNVYQKFELKLVEA